MPESGRQPDQVSAAAVQGPWAFRGLLAAYGASSTGAAVLPAVLALWVLDVWADLRLVGLILGVRTVGFILGAVVGGLVADRCHKIYTLIGSTAVRSVLAGAAALWGGSSLAVLCGCVLLTGVGEGVFRSSYQAVMPAAVGPDKLRSANAASTLVMRLSLTIGPMVVAGVYTVTDGTTCMWLLAAVWLLGAVAAAMVLGQLAHHPLVQPQRSAHSLVADYVAGLQEARRHRWFLAGLASLATWLAFAYGIQQVLLPDTSRQLTGSEWLVGVSLGGYAAGAACAALVLARYQPKPIGLWSFAGLALYGLVPISFLTGQPWLIIVAYFIGGVGLELFNVPWFTAIQQEIPADKIGRVTALDFLVSYSLMPVGAAVVPFAIAAYGNTPVLLTCGIVTIAVPLLSLATPGARNLQEPTR